MNFEELSSSFEVARYSEKMPAFVVMPIHVVDGYGYDFDFLSRPVGFTSCVYDELLFSFIFEF